jgi:hypothetical protein
MDLGIWEFIGVWDLEFGVSLKLEACGLELLAPP